MNWSEKIERPGHQQLNRVGSVDWATFLAQGRRISDVIFSRLERLGVSPASRILDFGCGIGRVFLPLAFEKSLNLQGCDIDIDAVRYLGRVTGRSIHHTNFQPPLPFADNQFDFIYSISIWTHLNPAMGEVWLKEMRRILCRGGVALITTSGYAALEARRQRGDAGWDCVDDEQLRRDGLIFVEYDGYRESPQGYPGVTEAYGLTAHDPAWVRANWGKTMHVADVEERVIDNVQDLVTLVKQGAN